MAIEALPNAVATPSITGETQGVTDGGGKAQGDAFAQMLGRPLAGGQQPAALDAVVRTEVLRGGGQLGIGEDIAGSLRRFGQTIGRMEEMGAYRARGVQAGDGRGGDTRGGSASDSGARQPPAPLPGPAELVPGTGPRARTGEDYIGKAMEMAHETLGHQAQLYKVMMDFTLVHSSAESLNKSLKTLLTQGGG